MTHPLRNWRLSHKPKLTLADLAAMANASAPHLSQIENGKRSPSVSMALRLSKATKGKVKLEQLAEAAEQAQESAA